MFCESDGCYLLLFIPVQLAQSDLKTFSSRMSVCMMCLNNFRKIFLKMQV